MKLLKFKSLHEDPGILHADGVLLRMPRMEDFEQWLALRTASRKFLQPWEPTWDAGEHKRSSFRSRLKRYQSELKSGKAISFFLFTQSGKILVGGLTIANIRRGVSQSCTLGYWMGEEFAGQGIMQKAVRRIIPYVFDELKLHRLEAAAIKNNLRSVSLLEKCGFRFEGNVRKYLKINGQWQDHRLYAILSDDPRQ